MSDPSSEFIVYSVSISLPKPILEVVQRFKNNCPAPIKPMMDGLLEECGLGMVDHILAQMPITGDKTHEIEGLQIQFYEKPQQAFTHLDQLSTALQMVLLPSSFLKGDPKPFTEFFLKQGTPWCRIDMVILENPPKEVRTKGSHARAFMDFVRNHPDKVTSVPCYVSPDEKAVECDVLHMIRQMDSTAEEFEKNMQHVFSKDFGNNGGPLN